MNQQNEFSNNHHKSNIEDLKGLLPDYLSREGITDLKHNFTCLTPKHADKNPSMTYYSDSQTVYCHGCNASFDIFDLFAIEHPGVEPNANTRVSYPNGFNDVYNQLAEYMNVDVKRFKVSPEDAQQNKINEFNRKVIQAAKGQLDQTDYLKKRGVSQELAQKFEIGFIPKWVNPTTVIKEGKELTPTPRLIIPTSSNSYLARDTRPSEDISANEKKYVKVKQGNAHIFNAAALANDNKPIFIVEGELDALSILEVTDKAQAVALGSTLQKIDNAIQEADFSSVDPAKLLEIKLKYKDALKGEYIPTSDHTNGEKLDSDKILDQISNLIQRIQTGEVSDKEAGIELKALSTALSVYDKTVLEDKLEKALEG